MGLAAGVWKSVPPGENILENAYNVLEIITVHPSENTVGCSIRVKMNDDNIVLNQLSKGNSEQFVNKDSWLTHSCHILLRSLLFSEASRINGTVFNIFGDGKAIMFPRKNCVSSVEIVSILRELKWQK